MKTYIYSILFILGAFLMSACHDNDSEPKLAQKTILMYMPYSGSSTSLYSNFLNNISDVEKSIKEQGGLGNNHFVYFISYTSSIAYLIDVDYNSKRKEIVRDTLETFSHPDLITAEGVSSILTKVKEYDPAESYAMLIESHGEGWIPANNSSSKVKSRYFGSGTAGFQTNVTDLAQAIEMADMHMQYILFDVCYMSCIENVYDLRNACDYLIGSTCEIAAYGMPYQVVLPQLLLPEPNYAGLTSNFINFYNTYSDPYATLAVVDTRYAEEMAQRMRDINLTYSISSDKLAEVQDLDGAHNDPTIYYDLGDYVNKMLDGQAGSDVLLSDFHNTLDKLVVYKVCTENAMSFSPYKIFRLDSFSGLSISDGSTNAKAITAKQATSWWNATH